LTDNTRVLIVDDHAVVRAGLKHILGTAHDLQVVAEAASLSEALAALKQERIDVILLDLTLGAESGMDLLKSVKAKTPAIRVVILSAFGEDQYAVQALKSGADGYLNKESAPESLIAAVRRVAAGNKYISPNLAEKLADTLTGAQPQAHEKLSDREFQVLRMIAAGRSLVSIAEELHVSTKTVTSYRSRVLEKMGFETNADLIRYALERGLLS
jgi:two-component system, NarL family, invasion response regulator UvrY